jgi:pyruvate kinase
MMASVSRREGAAALLRELQMLRADVVREGDARFGRWRASIERREFCASALNLAQYLALRSRDVRMLQQALTPWGLSSLGRSESHVVASLDAVIATLGALAGETTEAGHPPMHRFLRGERALTRQIDRTFGATQRERRVRIMVTMPSSAAEDYALIRTLLERGMDIARINCAHDTPDAWSRMIAHVRRAERETGYACRIHMDLGGPKARTGALLVPDKGRVMLGDLILLTRHAPTPNPEFPIQVHSLLPEALDQVKIGQRVWFDDGKLGTEVESIRAEGVILRVTQAEPDGFKLKGEKGLNFPDSDLTLNPLTDDDLQALDFIAQHADLIGYSFVQTGEDVALLQRELVRRLSPERARSVGIVAKIETQRAVRNLPDILIQAAGVQPFAVMIARGDLAVEIGFERLAEMQEELLWVCEAAHVPVIWATQVLENAVKKGRPSRAEMTDAAMSARADCVMLNKGDYIADALTLLDDVLRRMEGHQIKKRAQLRALRSWMDD